MKKMQFGKMFMLLLTAAIWGTAFVAQSVGMDYVEPFTFTFVRNIIGGLVLIPCIWFLKKLKRKENRIESSGLQATTENHSGKLPVTRTEWIGGICCGVALFLASNLQQIGIVYTTVGKAGFITALYVVIVPIMGIFFKKRVSILVWICVALSVIGLYLLCMTEGSFSLNVGDFLTLLCAIMFSVHIMVIDHFSPKGDGVVMSCIQFFVCGLLSGITMLFVENPQIENMLAAWLPIIYAGVFSSGIAYTLQVVAQKDMNPTIASLILCLESVVSAIAAWLILHEAMTTRELVGCGLMFAAIVMANLEG